MAKIENNVFLYGVSGMIGDQMVVRQTERGGVLAVAPRHNDGREPTEAQRAQQERFRLAVMYAKGAQQRPEYAGLAESRKVSPFNVATADFLHPPEIVELDVSQYRGRAGDTIGVRAVDDVQVERVGLVVLGEGNAVVEEGLLTQNEQDQTRWTYTATQDAGTDHVRIVVDATDLASQVTRQEAERAL